MKKPKQFFRKGMLGVMSSALVFSAFAPGVAADDNNGNDNGDNGDQDLHKLAIMGTTDIHANLMPYDYMADEEADDFGLSKVYSVVEEQREKFDNTLLIDNGDIIQGSILGNMETIINELPEGETNTIIQAMNMMDYDAAALGNHEFNFGLPILDQIVETSDFPWLGSNIYDAETDEHAYEPYTLLEREIDGKDITVGVLGFVPPQIMIWDNVHLDGEIYVEPIVETAEKLVPEVKEAGADIVVIASHSGIDINDESGENASYWLSQIDGVDALITGHLHYDFPGDTSRYEDLEGADLEAGTLNGVPTVMPGAWGDLLGMIELDLSYNDGEWTVENGIGYNIETQPYEPHQDIVELAQDLHERTIEYVNAPVGETAREMNTYFARVMDNSVVQLVNEAQIDFAESFVDGTEYEEMPILSAAAPFQAARFGPDYYTNVQEHLAVKDVADIYIYDNTLHIVKVDGNDVKRWLEYSARQFNQIDPASTEPQNLTNLDFRGFNFDVIEGIEYQIDVTRDVNDRITDLTYNGEPLDMDDEFLVVTNNYRASGGGDHLLGAESVEPVYQGTEENREVIIEYITEQGTIDVVPSNNWQIKPFEAEGRVFFQTSPDAQAYAERVGKEDRVTYVEQDEQGFGVFDYTTTFSHPHFVEDEDGDDDQQPAEPVFSDIDEDTMGYAAMMEMADMGVIFGYADGTFRPGHAIKRSEAAAMMVRTLGLDTENAEADFGDVSDDAWYNAYVGAAQEAGIFSGGTDGNFHPDREISRGEMAAVLVRAFELSGGEETPFTDIDGSMYKYAVEVLYGNGLTVGVSESLYGTHRNITRRDFAIMLYRTMN